MRHRKLSKKLNRDTSLRDATLRGIVSGLMLHERVRTTLTKAKVARRLADKLITLGKRGDIGSQNIAMQVLGDKKLVVKLFKEVSPLFKNRNGGYTRIILDRPRVGDGAMMALLEFTEKKEILPSEKTRFKKKVVKEEKKAHISDTKHPEAPGEKVSAKEEEKKSQPPKKNEEKVIVKEEIVKEKAKSETKKLEKGFFKGLKRYFRSKKG